MTTTKNTTSRNLHLSLGAPEDLENVVEALQQAGIKVEECRPVSNNNDGHIVTDLLAQGIWAEGTGANKCRGNCPRDKKHHLWKDLSEDQRAEFARRYAIFLTNCTSDELIAEVLLDDADEFEEVALSRDS